MKNHANHLIRYAVGRGSNLGKARNVTKSWPQFKNEFRTPIRTSERYKDFIKLPQGEQAQLKGVNGWLFAAQIEGKSRNANSVLPRDVLTFDFDYVSVEFFDEMVNGSDRLDFEYFVHTSRRHTAEKPRFRMLVPLKEPVPPDYFIAVSRIIGEMIDPGMENIDTVSFRVAQMMYMPTVCKDGDYVFSEVPGELLDVYPILDAFELTRGDWRDISLLPKTPDEGKLRQAADKAEVPTEKEGPVGDFCRAYSIEDAIEKFNLPYTPVDLPTGKPRYSYDGGTTTNGAEVQDGGLFLYSHHGSDPCSDMLVNAFDLVRIHKFGKEDDDTDPDVIISKRPSFKAMMEFISNDEAYKNERVRSRYDLEAMESDFDDAMSDFDGDYRVDDDDVSDIAPTVGDDDDEDADIRALVGDPVDVPEKKMPKSEIVSSLTGESFSRPLRPKPDKKWLRGLSLTDDGKIVANLPNSTVIVQNDLRTRNTVAYNEHMQETVLLRPFITKIPYLPKFDVRDKVNGDLWEDIHTHCVRTMIETENGPGKSGYGFKISDRDLRAGIDVAARHLSFHPIREYLDHCADKFLARYPDRDPWDVAESLWIDYLGVRDTKYHRQTSQKFLVACVVRAFEPGHKFDYSPILWGAQGVGKSSLVAVLARNWYGELQADFSNNQKLIEQMQGCWLMELPELSSIHRGQIEDVKAFISGTSTKARMAYATRAGSYLRQTCFIGSTNDTEFLIDTTGNRRWWPIEARVKSIDIARLREEVDYIWGAATLVYRQMREAQPEGYLPLHLTDPDVQAQANAMQEVHRVTTDVDVFAQKIAAFLDQKVSDDDFDHEEARRTVVCVAEIVDYLDMKHVNAGTGKVIGKALKECGWYACGSRRIPGYGVPKAYKPGAEVLKRWEQEDGVMPGQKMPRGRDDDLDIHDLI